MPTIPSTSARPANVTKRDMVEAGVATASETTSCMVLSSLTGTSGFRWLTIARKVLAVWASSDDVWTVIVISAGIRPSSRDALEL